jgi:hypothetical protein
MKKILRLVTTSVLTLTLVACGEASSSVSTSGTQTSSSVSSAVSNFANVSTITLSAATDVLTQTMGTQKAVVVQAALNANTNPSLALEWFVNGTKSNQTGRVFEYTPAAAGTFVIEAKSGSVLSNKISLTVGLPEFAITGEIKVVDASNLEITAPGGATVAVTNNTVEPASFYDLTKGVYVVKLKTAIVQGGTATVTLTREGNAPISKLVTFDTRKLEIDKVLVDTVDAVAKLVGTVYEVERPYILNATGDINANTTLTGKDTIKVTFKSTNLATAAGAFAAFKIQRLAAPAGAPAYVTQEGQIAVGATDAGGRFVEFDIDNASPAGDYEFELTLNGLSRKVTIRVIEPKAELVLNEKIKATDGKDYSLIYTQAGTGHADAGKSFGVVPTAAGIYEITKDFLLNANGNKTFTFTAFADNIPVPANLLGTVALPNNSSPNQLSVGLVGPAAASFMRVESGITQTALPNPIAFRNSVPNTLTVGPNSTGLVVSQIVDSTTPVGDYVYTVRVAQLGVELLTKTVTVRISNPAPKLTMTATTTDASNLVWNDVLSVANVATNNNLFVGISRTGLLVPTPSAATANMVVRITANGTIPATSSTSTLAPLAAVAGELWLNVVSGTSAAPVYTWTKLEAKGTAIGELANGDLFLDTADNKVYISSALDSSGVFSTWTEQDAAALKTQIETTSDFDAKYPNGLLLSDNKLLVRFTFGTNVTATMSLVTNESNLVDSYSAQVLVKQNNAFVNREVTPGTASTSSVWLGAVPQTSLVYKTIGTALASLAPTDAQVTAGEFAFIGTADAWALYKAGKTTASTPVNAWLIQTSVKVGDLLVIISADDTLATTNVKRVVTAGAGVDGLITTTHQLNDYVLATKDAAKDERILLRDNGTGSWIYNAGTGTFAAPKYLSEVIANGSATAFNQGLSNVQSFANSNSADLIYGDMSTGKLQSSRLQSQTTSLTGASGVFTVERPLRSNVDTKTIRFTAVVENFQSPLNQTAALKDSFSASANEAGLAGPREFVDFSKTYSGPMTLTNIAANTASRKVAIQVGSTNTVPASINDDLTVRTVSTPNVVADRFSSEPKYYDLLTTAREKLTIANVFELDVAFASLNGDYTFKLQVGALTQTVTVKVSNPAPKINVLVHDVLGNNMVAASATNEYVVSLNSSGNAELKLDVDFLNMQPASGSTLDYTLTRKYSFDTVSWTNTVSNSVAITNKLGTNGHVISGLDSSTPPVPLLSKVLQASSPDSLANSLTVNKAGTYEYILTVGTVTHTWKVTVNEFPTLAISSAFLGTTTAAGTTALTIFSKQPVVPMQASATDAAARLWLQVTPVNLAKGVHYYQITSPDAVGLRVPNIGGLTSTELGLVTLNFTTATTALVNLNPVLADKDLAPGAVAATAGFTAVEVAEFRVWIYNSAKVNIGYFDAIYRVINPAA